ncbi:hypothetical protein PIB30_098996 [Stylosanthes scabra]|uniref:Uncharacterized protein n=1 Tax=Stylosanthes scabra TaxID=79078 RepID=A0ABU6RXH7_9FABA|nr:hypothetical protein [Stylosanthes scabra]
MAPRGRSRTRRGGRSGDHPAAAPEANPQDPEGLYRLNDEWHIAGALPIGHSSHWHCAGSRNVAQNDALQLLQRIDGLHPKHSRTYGPKPNPVRIPAHLTIRI